MPTKKGVPRPNTGGGFDQHPENINRKGRPKVGLTVAERIRDAMNEKAKGQDGYTKFDEMVDLAMMRAKNGSWQFWTSLMNRAYGNVPDQIEVKTEKAPDLSKLTNEEIARLTELLEKARSD
jgi:hypothetical protein